MRSNTDGNLNFVSCHTGNILQCDSNSVIKCPIDNHYYWVTWRIVEPRATVKLAQVVPDQRHVLAGRERQNFTLELAKCGKTPNEIQQIVTLMFDAPAAASTSTRTPNRSAMYAIPVMKK